MPLRLTGCRADVVNLDQVRITAGRPPQDKPANVADPYRHAPGVRTVAEPSQAPASWIVKQSGQDVPDGQVERALWILP